MNLSWPTQPPLAAASAKKISSIFPSEARVRLMDIYVARQIHPPSGGDRLAPWTSTHPSKLVSSTGAVCCHLRVCSMCLFPLTHPLKPSVHSYLAEHSEFYSYLVV